MLFSWCFLAVIQWKVFAKHKPWRTTNVCPSRSTRKTRGTLLSGCMITATWELVQSNLEMFPLLGHLGSLLRDNRAKRKNEIVYTWCGTSFTRDMVPHLHKHQNDFLLKTLELSKTSVTFCCDLFKAFFPFLHKTQGWQASHNQLLQTLGFAAWVDSWLISWQRACRSLNLMGCSGVCAVSGIAGGDDTALVLEHSPLCKQVTQRVSGKLFGRKTVFQT